jgi:predicted MPP superfamily phosphohydrolase
MPRTIAIGDIHGCAIALAKLIEIIAPQPDDTLVPLGDYVDRGIDSRGVIDQLLALADRCRLVPILGNHEEMLLGAREGRSDSGKIAIVGHTPQHEILDLGYLKCLDTNCCYGGLLTALDVDTNQLWQVDEKGEVRA